MSHEIFVDHFSHALGEDAFSVEQSASMGRTLTHARALREAGFVQHHVCRAGTTAYELALRAARPLAASLGDAGAIFYATCLTCNGNLGDEARFRETGDVKHLMDYPVSHLQAELGLDRAAAIGINQQACTSMLGALRLARALLRDDPHLRRILCVTADRFPEGAIYEQAYNLISDGAAACMVTTEPRGYRIVSCHAITNGALSQATDDETVGSYFNYTHRLIAEALAKARLSADQIDWLVPQNTHANAWKIMSRLLKVDLERIFLRSISEVGHIISSDNVVNLRLLEREVGLKSGTRLLLFMAGFGLNWQSVILEKV